jgi:hypothetical protein
MPEQVLASNQRWAALSRRARVWALAASVGVTACSEGYQADADQQPFTPEQWTPSARLTHLNGLGEAGSGSIRWQYAAGPERCVLVIERQPRFRTATQQQLDLGTVTFKLARPAEAGTFLVIASGPEDRATVEVFTTRSRIDAMRAEQLLELLQRDCRLPASVQEPSR